MSSEQNATASLRVFGRLDDWQAQSLFALFGENVPEKYERGGEELLIYKSSLDESFPLTAHIEEILETLEAAPFEEFKKTCNLHVDMFCMYSSGNGQGSLELDASILKRLAALKIDLIVDLYPPTCPHCDEED